MALNSTFWAPDIVKVFCREVQLLHETLNDRILTNFKNIDRESEEISQAEYDRIGSTPGGEYYDMEMAAEHAQEMGISHYEHMTGIRQGILNLFAVAYWHVFEQQAMFFHRRQILNPSDENNINKIKMSNFIEHLNDHSIDLTKLKSWHKIVELEFVSNVIKHAEGRSAEALRKIRPDLFLPLMSRDYNEKMAGRVFKPMMGEDIYLTQSDLGEYVEAVCTFWNEFAIVISK